MIGTKISRIKVGVRIENFLYGFGSKNLCLLQESIIIGKLMTVCELIKEFLNHLISVDYYFF